MRIKTILTGVLAVAVLLCIGSAAVGVSAGRINAESPPRSAARLHAVPIRAVRLGEGIWKTRFRTNADTSIPEFYKHLENAGALDKLRGRKNKARGNSDADLAKWIEAASFVLMSEENETVRNLVRAVVNDILASAKNGGYLHTRYMLKMPSELAKLRPGGYLYCLGHLLQASIAYHQATGDGRLLDVFVPYVDNVIDRFGPGKNPCWSGHPEIELALVELYKSTGRREYRDFAYYLLEKVDLRGEQMASGIDLNHYFAGTPFSSRTALSGHAVCALYRCCGAANLYLESGDNAILNTLTTLWSDLTQRKMYVTGGVGSRSFDEAIGDPYELPNEKGYAETCAAIANIMWNRRMLDATGQARFADLMELTLYNGFLSGISLDGHDYFYWNPLLSRSDTRKERRLSTVQSLISEKKLTGIGLDVRQPYYPTPCCIPNAQRMIASLPGYVYGTSSDGLWVHLYHGSRLNWHLEDGEGLVATQSTRYPWEGTVEILLEDVPSDPFSLFVRIPYWAASATISVNGKSANVIRNPGTYHRIKRRWHANDRVQIGFDMAVRTVHSNPLVRENRGRIALQRGPIVYCLESVDHQDASVFDIALPSDLLDITDSLEARFEPDLLGGVVTLRGVTLAYDSSLSDEGLYSSSPFSESLAPSRITAIPYFAWANRGPSEMTVWIWCAEKK